MINALKRKSAAEATRDRFIDRPLAYGRDDCARMAAFLLRQRGHKPLLSKAGTYSTQLGAARALRRAGFATLADPLDQLMLPRIAPLAALTGDLLLIPGEGPFGGALMMALGDGTAFGWHEDLPGAGFVRPMMEQIVAAWRV